MRRRHVEAGEQPAEQGVERRARTEVVRRRVSLGDHQRDDALGRHDVRDQGRARPAAPGRTPTSSGRRTPRSRAPARRVRGPAAAARPARTASSRDASSLAASVRSSARSAATCSSCGTRTGCTRLASIRARSDHSNSTSGDRDRLATRSPRTASRRPWPVTIVCRSRLPERALPLVQVGQPTPDVRQRVRLPAGPLGERRPDVAVAQPYGERRGPGDADRHAGGARASSWSPRRRTTRAQSSRTSVAHQGISKRGQLRRQGIPLGHQGRTGPTEPDLGTQRERLGAHPVGRRHRAREPRPGGPRGRQRPAAGSVASAACAMVSSACPRRCWSRWFPKVRAASSRTTRRPGSARPPSAPRPGPGC